MAQTFDTSYRYMILYSPALPTAIGAGAETLEQAAKEAAKDLAFIRTLDYPGQPSFEWVHQYCRGCSGNGFVARHGVKGRYLGTKTCPACRGKNSERDATPQMLMALNTLAAAMVAMEPEPPEGRPEE